ncbi:hypothetical protein KIH23_03315 [Flavobacterium sp. CYK-55]|uniref:hypothetical protein n=1 Tax=Flavobacterium sp. CYK-55 TaxID=2835529 RepID=UPI001BCD84BC|nr:hypothetical protein [Flavobacterium sp. CYK-55]MBS7786314.1 hypothetical protein [Flavobacterium sp. CYK-55]
MFRLNPFSHPRVSSFFEDKDESTCSIQWRALNNETTLLAFCLVLSLVAMLLTIPLLASSFEPDSAHEFNKHIFQVSELPITTQNN